MPKTRLWTTRPYQQNDEAHIAGLVNASAAASFDAAHWKWLFKDSTDTVFIEYAWHGEKLVGQYAVVPVPMSIDGREATWCISLDTASHPDYRRQGMFTTLARTLYGRLADAGVEVVYGLPNEQSSFGFYKRLDWVRVQPHVMCYLPGSITSGMQAKLGPATPVATRLAAIAARLRSPAERAVARIAARGGRLHCHDQLPDGLDALCTADQQGPGIRVHYDAKRLHWRYMKHPAYRYTFVSLTRDGTLAGLAVIRPPQLGTLVGHIMDVFMTDSTDLASASALVASATGHLHAAGATSVRALSAPGSTLHRAMQLAGYLGIRPKRGDWVWTLGARVLGGKAIPGDVYDGHQWHVGWGIHDQM